MDKSRTASPTAVVFPSVSLDVFLARFISKLVTMAKSKSQVPRRVTKTKRLDRKQIKSTGNGSLDHARSVVDLTDLPDHPMPSPSMSTVSEKSVGIPTIGAPTRKAGAGRPKESPVWKFFRYNEETDKSICLVEGCSTTLCGHNTGNNRAHLLIHPKAYEEYVSLVEEQNAAKKQKKPCSLAQVTVDQMAQARKPYEDNHPR